MPQLPTTRFAKAEGVQVAYQVLVRVPVDLTFGSQLTFESRGDHELKGFPGSWELFATVP